MIYILTAIIIIVSMFVMAQRTKFALHMIQIKNYETDTYKMWLKENKDIALSLYKRQIQVYQELDFTKRATRLYRLNLFVNIIILVLFSIPALVTGKVFLIILLLIGVALIYLLDSYIMILSNSIILPIENNINTGFYLKAQEKIENMKDLRTVGITGSFGKTSTKFIANAILEQNYNVLNPPESYNTPMGLSKTINDELEEGTEVFLAEMGAKRIGDIREIAKLCKPHIGIITSVGPTNMDTFRNIDNVMKTKYELIEELPAEGIAIFNYDDRDIRKLADKTFKEKLLYGLEDTENLDIYADDIVISEYGSAFTLRDKEGNSERCTTKLLGKHNISNILAGVCASRVLGLSFEEIGVGIENIKPIPHRLTVKKSNSGIIMIDDTFNSDPAGTKAALEVLNQFKEGKKIIVTPGMIELGDLEEDANIELGENIGKICDYAILVGSKRTDAIYKGLMEENFNEDNIFIVDDIEDIYPRIQRLAKPKDIVLFENDLPDIFTNY